MNQFSDHGAASIREGGGGRLNLSSRSQVEKRNDQYRAINSERSFHTTYLHVQHGWCGGWGVLVVLGSCLRKRQLRSGFFLKMATYDAFKTVGLLTNEKISNLKY